MRRLYSLIILVAGIAAGAAGSYWYAHRSETVATPAAAEQSQPACSRAEDSLLPESHGASRHLAGAEEGLHGHGLHSGLCR